MKTWISRELRTLSKMSDQLRHRRRLMDWLKLSSISRKFRTSNTQYYLFVFAMDCVIGDLQFISDSFYVPRECFLDFFSLNSKVVSVFSVHCYCPFTWSLEEKRNFSFKGTVSVISSDPPCNNGHAPISVFYI